MRKKSRLIAPLLFAALTLAACASPFRLPKTDGAPPIERPVEGTPVTIYCGTEHEDAVPLIERAVVAAVEACAPWGRLRAPVRVLVYSDAAELAEAVRRESWGHLSGFANERDLALVAPGGSAGWETVRFRQLVVHEMTHVIHYQTARIASSGTRRDDPFWFREGLATVTAGEAAFLSDRAELARALKADPPLDPLDVGDDDIRQRGRLVYGAAASLFAFFLDREGPEGVRDILERIAAGSSFSWSFRHATGYEPEELRREWAETFGTSLRGF